MWWLISCVSCTGPPCPDLWSNIILDVSVRVFPDELNVYTNGLCVKQIALHNEGGPRPIRRRPEETQRLTSPSESKSCSRWTLDLNFGSGSSCFQPAASVTM